MSSHLHYLVFSFTFFFWSIFSEKIPFFGIFPMSIFQSLETPFLKKLENTISSCVFSFNSLWVLSVVEGSSSDSHFLLNCSKTKQISICHFLTKKTLYDTCAWTPNYACYAIYAMLCAFYMHVTVLPPLCGRHPWTMRALQHSTYAIKGYAIYTRW